MDEAIQILKMLPLESQPDLKTVYLAKVRDIPGFSNYNEEHVFNRSINSLINTDENHEIEFKETFSIPTKLGKDGVTEIVELDLNSEELENLKSAADSVKQKVLELNNLKTQ